MQQKLIILLHANDLLHPSWAVVDDVQVAAVTIRGEVDALTAEAVNERQVVVLVPTEDVLLTFASLPKMNRSRLVQAVPYAIEEQIIEDVETMHFAVGEHRADAPLTVAVIARTKMKDWLALLESWSVAPDYMLPSVFALPDEPDKWVAEVQDVAIVRMGHASGFACDKDNLNELLLLSLSATLMPPQEIRIAKAEPDTLALSLSVPVLEEQVAPEQLLTLMAQQMNKQLPLNLLQGDFQTKKTRRLPRLTSAWRVSVYLLAAWLALLFLYPVVSFAILNNREADIKNQIAAIYKRHFPDASSIVAPKERMQQKINKASAGFGDNRLLVLIANVGKGLAKAPGVQLKRLDFQNNVMTLEISAATSEVFSTFTDNLSQNGLRVKQQNANLDGAHVTATLQVE